MTTPSPVQPVPGFDRPETFVVQTSYKDFLVSAVVLVVALFLVSWLMFGMILTFIGVPSSSLVGLALAVIVTIAVLALRKKQLESAWQGTSLTISPQGLFVEDPTSTLSIQWHEVRGVGDVKVPAPVDARKINNPLLRGPGAVGTGIGGAIGQAVLRTQVGIAGLGMHTLKPTASMMARTQYEQNIGANGLDQQTGRPLVAVFAQQYDKDWTSGRIGDWVRAYRADVLS